MKTLFSVHFSLSSRAYPLVLLAADALVTLTWTCLVDWSTADGLENLAGVLVMEILAVGVVSALVLKWRGNTGAAK